MADTNLDLTLVIDIGKSNAKLLLLDEPGANLDGRSRRRLVEILDARSAAMLLATHDLPMVRRLCSRAILIDEGRVIADRPTDDLLSDNELLRDHGVIT